MRGRTRLPDVASPATRTNRVLLLCDRLSLPPLSVLSSTCKTRYVKKRSCSSLPSPRLFCPARYSECFLSPSPRRQSIAAREGGKSSAEGGVREEERRGEGRKKEAENRSALFFAVLALQTPRRGPIGR